jgi:hypothetical protein
MKARRDRFAWLTRLFMAFVLLEGAVTSRHGCHQVLEGIDHP